MINLNNFLADPESPTLSGLGATTTTITLSIYIGVKTGAYTFTYYLLTGGNVDELELTVDTYTLTGLTPASFYDVTIKSIFTGLSYNLTGGNTLFTGWTGFVSFNYT